MIYLASVYSLNADKALMEERYQFALKHAAAMTKQGMCIFSPIVHSHPMSLVYDMPVTFDFWSKVDYKFLDASERLVVLAMDGWKESKGVQAEIAYAEKIGLPWVLYKVENSPPAGVLAAA